MENNKFRIFAVGEVTDRPTFSICGVSMSPLYCFGFLDRIVGESTVSTILNGIIQTDVTFNNLRSSSVDFLNLQGSFVENLIPFILQGFIPFFIYVVVIFVIIALSVNVEGFHTLSVGFPSLQYCNFLHQLIHVLFSTPFLNLLSFACTFFSVYFSTPFQLPQYELPEFPEGSATPTSSYHAFN